MFDFFISHASCDKPTIVDDLVSILQNLGYTIWYDRNELLAGDSIFTSIQNGLLNSYCLILVISDNFINSKWTFLETGLFETNNYRIIPLIYDVSEANLNQIMGIIGNRKYLNMNSISKEVAVDELARALNYTKNKDANSSTIEKLNLLQKQFASFGAATSKIISLRLKKYLALIDTHNDFLSISAKKIVEVVIEDLIKSNGYQIANDINNKTLLRIIKDKEIGSVIFRDYCEFILLFDNENKDPEYSLVINHALYIILTFYLHTKYLCNFTCSEIEVVFPEELTYGDFADMFEIDKKVMREDLIADTKTTYGWFQHNQYTHIGVRDKNTGRLVGYFAVLPITDDAYDKILCGEFKDKDFTSDSIEQYIFPDFYRVYVAGVGIEPKYQNTGVFIKLYNALIDLFVSLAKNREIYISEILAEASTKQGEKLCKLVGMKKVCVTKNDTDVYRLITIPPEFRIRNKRGKELYQLCEKKYEEYRDFFGNN